MLTQILMKNVLSLHRKSRKNPRPHLRWYLTLGFFDLAILWWYPLFCYCRWDWRYWQVRSASFHNSFLQEPVHFRQKNFIEIQIYKSFLKNQFAKIRSYKKGNSFIFTWKILWRILYLFVNRLCNKKPNFPQQ